VPLSKGRIQLGLLNKCERSELQLLSSDLFVPQAGFARVKRH